MPKNFLTLLDMTKRQGSDAAVGLVEEVETYAPEVAMVMGRPIGGTSFQARVRTAYPEGGAFRAANQGTEPSASKFDVKRFDCFFFDAQLRVDEAVVRAAEGQGDSKSSVLADEASGAMQDKTIKFGEQFYKGRGKDDKGFPGLVDYLDNDLVVDATGVGATTYKAWFIYMDITGIHFLFGGNQGIDIKPWREQYVADPNAPSKQLLAHVSNISGFLGLACARSKAVGCIKNLTSAKPLTDALGHELLAKFPIGRKPNLCFVERNSSFWLQRSRSATSITNRSAGTSNGSDIFAPAPTEIANVKLVVTDSIKAEAAA